jgi:hypothetical protein
MNTELLIAYQGTTSTTCGMAAADDQDDRDAGLSWPHFPGSPARRPGRLRHLPGRARHASRAPFFPERQ